MTRPSKPVRRMEARRRVHRTSQASAVAATAHMDAVPPATADYWWDLRRGRRWVYGGVLRFIDRCAELHTPLGVVLSALDALRWYAFDVYGEPQPAHA